MLKEFIPHLARLPTSSPLGDSFISTRYVEIYFDLGKLHFYIGSLGTAEDFSLHKIGVGHPTHNGPLIMSHYVLVDLDDVSTLLVQCNVLYVYLVLE